jgi:hypothetical protein
MFRGEREGKGKQVRAFLKKSAAKNFGAGLDKEFCNNLDQLFLALNTVDNWLGEATATSLA